MLKTVLATVVAMTALALSTGCDTDLPLNAGGVAAIFKDKGATGAECKTVDGAQLCRLTMADGTTPTVVVTGDTGDWSSKPCLASDGCKGWDAVTSPVTSTS